MFLKGKNAIVTGASRGIGRALALGLAAHGATVVATARTQRASSGESPGSLDETVGEIRDAGGRATAITCDVADEGQVAELVRRTLAEVGPIDVLVNNAAIWLTGPITEFDTRDWDRIMAVNVRGPFVMCKYVLPGMMERRQGSVVNITSGCATTYEPESPAYGPSKAALDRLTLNLAMDMKPYNIAVNALSPGLVASAMTAGYSSPRTPSPPEDVVPAVLWLAQQDASTFTGHVVHRNDFGKGWP